MTAVMSDAVLRRDLPNRRPHFIGPAIRWPQPDGASWLIGVGLDPDGKACEVFADLADAHVEVEPAIIHLVHEASITASHLLQCGIAAPEHASRLEPSPNAQPGLLYLMLRRAAETEAQLGDGVRQLADWRRRIMAGEDPAAIYRDSIGAHLADALDPPGAPP